MKCAFWLALLGLLSFSDLQAQEKIDSLLFTLEDQYPLEKVHLHLDRDYYSPGETIWFKLYVIADRQTGAFSRTCYIDLIGEDGQVLANKALPMIESAAASGFDIPAKYAARKIYLRAYTRWMQETNPTQLPLRTVIVNALKPANSEKINPVPELFFYPEGGEWVGGLATTMAFRANYSNGEPANVKGSILDSKGKKISDFQTVHFGMGKFNVTPEAGEQYKAVWKEASGKTHETLLPAVKTDGLILQVTLQENELKYTLRRSNSARLTNLYVVAQAKHQLQYAARINLSNKQEVTAPINTDSIPDGVVQITVFDANRQPVAERLVFVNHNNHYFITDFTLAEKSFEKRGRNVLLVAVSDTFKSNLSVSVTDLSLNQPASSTPSIFSDFLLASDVRGHIYRPDYYFTSTNDSLQYHTDLVMLTTGWRRFNWSKLLTDGLPMVKQLPQQYIQLNGKIVGLNATQLAGRSVNLMLNTGAKANNLLTLPVSKEGTLELPELYFFDTAKVYYQFNNDKDRRLTSQASFQWQSDLVRAHELPTPDVRSSDLNVITDTVSLKKQAQLSALHLNNVSKLKELEVVTVKSTAKSATRKLEDQFVSGLFSGGDGQVFNLVDDQLAQGAFNILTYLQGRVAGLQINATGTGSATWRGTPTSFFLNEMPVDLQQLQSINIQDVALIKVFRPPFIGAAGGGGGGAVAIYTKRGDLTPAGFKGLDNTIIQGYSTIREFKGPDYPANDKSTIPDYRPTLLWSPFVLTDKLTRKIYLPFYNNDQGKAFRVVIEGINEQGKLTREEKIIR